jgi:hypothetical protein
MKDLMQEALEALQRQNAPEPSMTYQPGAFSVIEAEINASLRDSIQTSREIQARSEVSAAKLFLTF